MKRNVFFAIAAVAAVVSSVVISSCGKEEPETPNKANPNIPAMIFDSIFYIPSTSSSFIHCKWDEIDYDTCFFQVGSFFGRFPDGGLNDGLAFNCFTTLGNEYFIDVSDFPADKMWVVSYRFRKKGYDINSGKYICQNSDDKFTDGSKQPGFITLNNGKKWYLLRKQSSGIQYTCNSGILVEKKEVSDGANGTIDSLISVNAPFRGLRLATDEELLELEKSLGMPDDELDDFSESRGEKEMIGLAFSKTFLRLNNWYIPSPYISINSDGKFVFRTVTEEYGITREVGTKTKEGTFIYVEE